jgi:hypothetical protein
VQSEAPTEPVTLPALSNRRELALRYPPRPNSIGSSQPLAPPRTSLACSRTGPSTARCKPT